MKKFFLNNLFFLLPYAVFVIAGLFVILSYGKTEIHLKINSFVGAPFTDLFFTYVTYLGDGLFTLFIFLVLLFFSTKNAIQLILTYSISGLITQSLKHFVFADVKRPSHYFEWLDKHEIKFVDNVPGLIDRSFPSGHATAAFCLFFCFALFSNNNLHKFCFFLLAVVVAFSRVYLSQHFLNDIVAGSVIAVFSTLLVYYVLNLTKFSSKINSLEQNILLQMRKGK